MVSGAEASTADGGGFGEVVEFGEPRSALNTLSSQASTSLPSSCTVLTCTELLHRGHSPCEHRVLRGRPQSHTGSQARGELTLLFWVPADAQT